MGESRRVEVLGSRKLRGRPARRCPPPGLSPAGRPPYANTYGLHAALAMSPLEFWDGPVEVHVFVYKGVVWDVPVNYSRGSEMFAGRINSEVLAVSVWKRSSDLDYEASSRCSVAAHLQGAS
jgi:hypothetical protein